MASGGFFKMFGKGFSGAIQFSAHGIGGLADERGNGFVAQFLVGHEQQQEAVFVRQLVQGFLNALAEFLGLENAQGRIAAGGRIIND